MAINHLSIAPTEPHRRQIEQLSLLQWGRGSRDVRWPTYEPRSLTPGILHLGCGAFHRAHQNVFTQRAIEQNQSVRSPWGVLGVSFRRKHVKQILAPQDFLYTVLERGEDDTRAEVIGVLKGVLFAKEEQAAVVAAIKRPQTRIVSLTVTPSGYSARPDAADAIGLLVAGLAAVQVQGTPPPVLMSCDNIPANGRRLRQALVERAWNCCPSLGNWIDRNVQFPSSVVDRIVPAPTPGDSATASRLLGLSDLAAISAEPFRQWMIEDFDGPRPPWHLAGAQFVTDVTPWEASKLTLLNGTHMAIAFLGLLSGQQTVSDFVLDPLCARFTSCLMLNELVPAIPMSEHDLVLYSGELLQRWKNVHMKHQLQRIGRNSSDKLQTRLLASISANMAAGRAIPCSMLAIAAWLCFIARLMPSHCVVEDNSAAAFVEITSACQGDIRRVLSCILAKTDIFGDLPAKHPDFSNQLAHATDFLRTNGVRAALSRSIDMTGRRTW